MVAAREELDSRVGLSLVGFKAEWQLPIGIHLSESGVEISEQQEESECDTKAPLQVHHNILPSNTLSAKVSWPSGNGSRPKRVLFSVDSLKIQAAIAMPSSQRRIAIA